MTTMPSGRAPAAVDAEAPALGESRSRVLSILQDARTPLGVTDVAEQARLHPNTARFHLDGLVDAGHVDRTTEERERPGRPRALYTARADNARGGRRSYRLLAEILTSYIASQDPRPTKAALQAGAAWGRYLADRPRPYQRTDTAKAMASLVSVLDDVGFAPEAKVSGRRRQVLLHHCPFREAAENHEDIVCSVHLGLMQGALAELNTSLTADRLDPFVEPSLCVAHLSSRSPSGASRPSTRASSGTR